MILTAHQPGYLPWLGLMHKIAISDQFVYFDRVQYVAKDWISRNQIKSPTGPLLLTVPVLTTGHRDKTIADMQINNSVPWRRKHWRSIVSGYKSARYFSAHADFLEHTYRQEWSSLSELNLHILKWMLATLGISTPIIKMEDLNLSGSKSELVLSMCEELGADVYVFGALGRDYADVAAFEAAGVLPVFQSYNHPSYLQQHGDFLPNLSSLDLILNEGPASLEIIMAGNLDRVGISDLAQATRASA